MKREKGGHTDKQANILTGKQTYRHTDRQTGRQAGRQTHRQTGRQTDTDRQAGRQAGREESKTRGKRRETIDTNTLAGSHAFGLTLQKTTSSGLHTRF